MTGPATPPPSSNGSGNGNGAGKGAGKGAGNGAGKPGPAPRPGPSSAPGPAKPERTPTSPATDPRTGPAAPDFASRPNPSSSSVGPSQPKPATGSLTRGAGPAGAAANNSGSSPASAANAYRDKLAGGESAAGAAGSMAGEAAARQGLKRGADMLAPGSGEAAAKVPGGKQVFDGAGKLGGKVGSKVAVLLTSSALVPVLIVLALLAGMVGLGSALLNSAPVLAPPMPTEQQCAQLPEGWCQVVWAAQKSTEGSANPIPWAALAGIALAATDYGKTSPSDSIDRDPNRPASAAYASFALAAGMTGSAGISDSKVMLLGDSLSYALGEALRSQLKQKKVSLLFEPCGGDNGSDPSCEGTSAVSRTPAQLVSVLKSKYAAVAPSTVVIDIGTNGSPNFAKDVDDIVALLPGSQVYFLNLHAVGSARKGSPTVARYNKVLDDAAAKYPNVHVIDVASSVSDTYDGVHLRDYRDRAATVAAALGSPSSTSTTTGDSAGGSTGGSTGDSTGGTSGGSATAAPGRSWPLRQAGISDTSSKVWGPVRNGQILYAPAGAPVLAVANGVIQNVSQDDGQFGKSLVLRVTGADSSTTDITYRHVARVDVAKGQKVKAGDVIAAAGKSGSAAKDGVTILVASSNSSATPIDLAAWITDTAPAAAVVVPAAYPTAMEAVPANLSNSMPSTCPVDTATPPIVGPENSQGPFLLSEEVATRMRNAGRDPQNPCDSALELASQLASGQADSELYSARADTVEDYTEYLTSLLASSTAFVTPDADRIDCSLVPSDLPAQSKIAWVFRCEAAVQGELFVVTKASADDSTPTYSVASNSSGLAQLTSEAVAVAYNFSKLGEDKCDPAAPVAGVFPITKAQADEAGIDRCNFDENVRLAASLILKGEAVKPEDRKGSPYQVQAGGWSALPYALGDPEQFYAFGPSKKFNASPACQAELNDWIVSAAGTSSPLSRKFDTAEQLRAAFATLPGPNPLTSRVCDVTDPRAFWAYVSNWANQINVVRTGGPVAVGEVSVDDAFSTGTIVNNPTTVELVPGTTYEGVLNVITYAEEARGAARTAVSGTDSLVPRLSTSGLRVQAAPAVTDLPVAPSMENYAASAAATSAQLAGGPINWIWTTPDLIGGAIGYMGGEFGGRLGTVIAAAKSQIGVPYVSGGGTYEGPGQPGTCYTAGSPGGCTGVGVGLPPGFDCSKFTAYAYYQAGVKIIPYSVSQYQMDSISGDNIDPRQVPSNESNLLPGDLVFWGANGTGGGQITTHVALYIGNGEIIEAGNPIGIQKLADAIASDSRQFMPTATRIFPEAELRASLMGAAPGGFVASGPLLTQASSLKDTTPFPAGSGPNSNERMGEWLNSNRVVQPGTPRADAVAMMTSQFGWPVTEWACLDRLWWHESGWDPQTTDAMQGTGYGQLNWDKTFGIPQANPARKMLDPKQGGGPDAGTNPVTQIRWGLTYIKNSYGSPCGAWKAWVKRAAAGSYGWY